MSEFGELERATALLRTAICNFPIGAVTLTDFKPIGEKIRDTRELIKCLNARIQFLRATSEMHLMPSTFPEGSSQLEKKLQGTLSRHVHKYKILKDSTQSLAVEKILSNNNISPATSSKLKAVMNKLFRQNDKMISLQEEMDDLYVKERNLQIDVAAAVIDFQDFLKEQEEIRNQKLAESNPEIAAKKEKLKKLIIKINITKRLITNLISAANVHIDEEPDLLEMLKKHRDLVNTETIVEMVQNRES